MEFEKVKAKGRGLNPFFPLGRPERYRATWEKKGLEGSREAKEMELIMHEGELKEERQGGTKPCRIREGCQPSRGGGAARSRGGNIALP